MSQSEVQLTTKLNGTDTEFMPFNKSIASDVLGNTGYATKYLWEEVLQPDHWLNILGCLILQQTEEQKDASGNKTKKETITFPPYHQLSE